MADFRSVLDMAHNIANQMWKRSLSQNVVVPAVVTEAASTSVLQKLGIPWIPSHAPAFSLNSKNVQILNEPKAFYRLLLEQIEKANHRIVLSSLYIGTGLLEENLVLALKKRLMQKSDLKIKFLLDCTRGSRGVINSRKMLLPLLEYKDFCQVSLYQPAYRQGSLIPFLPTKYREVAGLHHMKVYLFDNNFIITGANLSSDYFTNRQDRYLFIQDTKELCDFIEGLVEKVSEFSYKLNADDTLSLGNTWNHDPSKTSPKAFNFAAATSIRNYYDSFMNNSSCVKNDHDTLIFPLLEMGPFGIHVDSTVTTKLLEKGEEDDDVYLTTGYFNLTESYKSTIIEKSKARFSILMAHPTTNGFYKANFPAGGIPHAYTYLATKFLKKIERHLQSHRIKMYEYVRPQWTYHAKGLWFSTPDHELPFITMIGSPNFGERSVKHDLECQFLVATTCEELQYELLQERQSLFNSSVIFSTSSWSEPEREVPAWVKAVVFLFRSYL